MLSDIVQLVALHGQHNMYVKDNQTTLETIRAHKCQGSLPFTVPNTLMDEDGPRLSGIIYCLLNGL